MIRSLNRTALGKIEIDIPISKYLSTIEDVGSLLWVDIYDKPDEVKMLNTFKFHSLAVADAIDKTYVPGAVFIRTTFLFIKFIPIRFLTLLALALNKRIIFLTNDMWYGKFRKTE